MKRFLAIALLLLQLPLLRAQTDSLRMAALDSRLDEYFALLETQDVQVKIEECDTLISCASDSSIRRHIALRAYGHYLDSKLMGDEAVAVHLADRWFIPGIIRMDSAVDLVNARIFADFNRSSLIGRKAPRATFAGPQGDSVTVGGSSDSLSVFFFYDTDCAKCKFESLMLKKLLEKKNYPLRLVAIYTGCNPDSWAEWRQNRFSLNAGRTSVVNLWDPEVSSDYQKKYGVLSTPQMFLVSRDGTILGRRLDTESLEVLLESVLDRECHEYGGPRAGALLDGIFLSYGDSLRPGHVVEVAEMIRRSTLQEKDTLAYKNLTGDLLYYLSSRREEALREGSAIFIDEYILSQPEIWNCADDSLRVVGLAALNSELLSRTPVGSRLPSLPIKGWGRIRRRGGLIVFHSRGCPVCREELEAAERLGLDCLAVDVDETGEKNPELLNRLLDTFDLMSMPMIIRVGRRGEVTRRYVSLLNNFVFSDK
ncbi:MAG: hypothetical protein ACI399_03325 [Candidatus Cryptobacteroides sp.]